MKLTILRLLIFLFSITISAKEFNIVIEDNGGNQRKYLLSEIENLDFIKSVSFWKMNVSLIRDSVSISYLIKDINDIRFENEKMNLIFDTITIVHEIDSIDRITFKPYSPEIVWAYCYGGQSADDIAMGIQSGTNKYIFAGSSSSNNGDVIGNHGIDDVWVFKSNENGIIDWTKVYGGSYLDAARTIVRTFDGGYIITGFTGSKDCDISVNKGQTDCLFMKINEIGEIQWIKTYGGSLFDYGNSIIQTSDGGYIAMCQSESNDGDVTDNHGNYDIWIIRLSESGSIIWQKTLGGSKEEYGQSIVETEDGGYILASYSFSNDGDVTGNHGKSDIWLVKISDTGAIQWQKTIGGSQEEMASQIFQTNDSGYLLSCITLSQDGDVDLHYGKGDLWVLKLSNSGEIQWQKTLGGSEEEEFPTPIIQTDDGGFILSVSSKSNDFDVKGNHGSYDYWIVKLSATGDVQWTKTLGGSLWDYVNSIFQTDDGYFIVSGITGSNDGDVYGFMSMGDAWIVKLKL